jgi:gliding motility-associated-like protein
MLMRKLLLPLIFIISFSSIKGQTNVTVSDYCPGTARDFSTSFGALAPGVTFIWTVTTATNVKNHIPQPTASPTVTQNIGLVNSAANGRLVLKVTASDAKIYNLTIDILALPFISNKSAWSTYANACGSINFNVAVTGALQSTGGFSWIRNTIWASPEARGNSANITDNIIDTTGSTANIPFYISMYSSIGCLVQDTLTYKINPTPVITDFNIYDTICSDVGIKAFTPKTQISSGVYMIWASPSAAGLSGMTAGTYSVTNPVSKLGNFNQQKIINATALPISVTYSLTPIYPYNLSSNTAYCAATSSVQYTVTVNPKPQLLTTQTTAACSGTPFRYSPPTGVSGTTIIPASTVYTWVAPQYSDTGLLKGGTGLNKAAGEYVDAPVSQILTNRGLVPQFATYNIYAKAGNCESAQPFDLVVTVFPTPVVTPPSDTLQICSGSLPIFSSLTATPTGTGIITNYNWTTPQLQPAGSLTGTGISAQSNQVVFAPSLNNLRTTTSYASYVVTPSTTYSIAPSPTSACAGTAFKIVIKVNPIAALGTQTIVACSNDNFISTPNPVPQGTTYTWSSPTLATGLFLNTGDKNINIVGDTTITGNLSYTGVNTGGNATFTVVPKSGACIGNPFSLVVTVRPLPVVSTASRIACSGAQFSTSPTSNLTGITTSYTWGLPDILPVGALVGASANTSPIQSITQTLLDVSNNISQATYTVTPIAQGCPGKPFTFVATVNPTPAILNKDTTICPGNPFSLNPSPLPFITTYTWDAPIFNIPNAVLGGVEQTTPLPSFSQVLTNTTNSVDVMSTYKITPRFGECVGKPFSIVVTVKASPYITDTLVSTVCSGSPFSVAMPNNLPAGSLYKWVEPTYSNGITGGSPQDILQTLISQTLRNTNSDTTTGRAFYNVTPVANGCIGNPFTVKVNVKANSATLTSPLNLPAICSGTPFNYTPTSNFPGTAFIWVRDGISGLQNAATSGYADINELLIDSIGDPITVNYRFSLLYNGCLNAKTQVVKVVVNPQPILTSPFKPTPICSENLFNYTPVSSTRDVSFSWSRSYVVGITEPLTQGFNSISEKLTNTTFNIVQVPYVFTMSANGCTNQQTVYEVVNPVLTLNDQTNPVCSGTNFTINPPNSVGAVFLWSRPSLGVGLIGGTENTIIPTTNITGSLKNLTDFPSVAVYNLTPIIPGASSGGCLGNPFKLSVVVNPIPVLSSAKTLPDICSGTPFTYIPTSNTPGTIFSWTRNSIEGLSNLSSRGSFLVDETLLDSTINPVKVIYNYRTTFNGCTDSTQFVTFTVNPAPIVPDQKITICSGSQFSLPVDLEPIRTSYTWAAPTILPSGSLSSFTQKTAPQTLVYDTLNSGINSNSLAVYTIIPSNPTCTLKPFNVFVTVKPIAKIGDQNANSCNGQQIVFTPSAVPSNTLYKWKFNEVNPSFALGGYTSNDTVYKTSINQTLANSGNSIVYAGYQIQTSTNGCVGLPFQLRLAVNPTPRVKITGSPNLCINATDTLGLSFTGTGPWSISYIDNKDGFLTQVGGFSKSNSIFVQPNLPNDSVYRMTIMNVSDAYCSSDTNNSANGVASIVQRLNKLPLNTIIAPNGNLICVGQFKPMSISPLARVYQWYRNDTLISNANSVNFNAYVQGTYTAMVTDSLGCINMTVNSIKMADLKTFDISFSNDPVNCINTVKQFINYSDTSSVRNISWKWNFNGEDSSKMYNATAMFKKGGLKKITLSASVPSCTYSISKDSLIMIAEPVRAVKLETVSTNSARPIQLKARTFEGINYAYDWQPSWGLNFYRINNPVFSYNQTQTYFIKMTSPTGCITVDTVKVLVFDSALVTIFVPKSFTPNGDGVNDLLYPYIAGMKSLTYLKIFNKFGKQVYETRTTAQGWNGISFGKQQPMDAYLWIAEGIDIKGNKVQQTGSVLLIR